MWVVTPRLAAYFMASSALRRRSAGFSRVFRRKSSAFVHSLVGKPPATDPSAPTLTPFARRNDAARVFAAPGPVKLIIMNTGLFGAAESSSATVGEGPESGFEGSAQGGLV